MFEFALQVTDQFVKAATMKRILDRKCLFSITMDICLPFQQVRVEWEKCVELVEHAMFCYG